MGDPARKIEPQALQLPPKECARLAQRLIASLDPESDRDAEQVWLREAERRLDELESGEVVFSSPSVNDSEWRARPFPTGLFRSACRVPAHLLNCGVYRLKLVSVRDAAHIPYRLENALEFEVHDVADDRGGWYGKWPGVVRPDLEWTTELLRPGLPEPTQTDLTS